MASVPGNADVPVGPWEPGHAVPGSLWVGDAGVGMVRGARDATGARVRLSHSTIVRSLHLVYIHTAPCHRRHHQSSLFQACVIMINLSDRVQPFFDRYLIESLDNVAHRLHPPARAEAVMQFDQPWEGPYAGYPQVILDAGLYRLYYRGWRSANSPPTTCVATSTDGIHFERASLNLFPLASHPRNNIVQTGTPSHNFFVFIDESKPRDSRMRFKAVGAGRSSNKKRGLQGFQSNDGYHWLPIQTDAIITQGAFDSQNIVFWSAHEQQYVAYFRIFDATEDLTVFKGKRTMARATSTDFINWSDSQPMKLESLPEEQFYTNATHPYFRNPELYVALPKRFFPPLSRFGHLDHERLGTLPGQGKGLSDVVLLTTRANDTYDRAFPEALITPGLDEQNWSARALMPGPSIVPTSEHEMSFYAIERYGHPVPLLRRFVSRIDGLASIHAGHTPGTLTTPPMTFAAGSQLCLNLATSALGSAKVEIQDEAGQPIPGYTLSDATALRGDGIALNPRWGDLAGVAQLANRPIRLKIQLQDAHLYSIAVQ